MYQNTVLSIDTTQPYMNETFAQTVHPSPIQLSDDTMARIDSQLYQLTRILHRSLDLDQVLHDALHSSGLLADSQRACIIVFDEYSSPERWLTSVSDVQLSMPQMTSALYNGLQGQAIRQQRVLLIDDAAQRLADQPTLLAGRSFLVVPLTTETDLIGVLTLTHDTPAMFHQSHAYLFERAAETMAQAIQHAHRYTRLYEDAHQQEAGKYQLIHDLRSPLTAARASLEVIKRALHIHPAHEEIRTMIDESIQSGQQSLTNVLDLTNNLLDIRKLQIDNEALEYQSVTLEILYGSVIDMLKDVANEKQVFLRYQVTPRTLKLPADPQFLRRLLINLTANAVRFTPEGGSVTLLGFYVPASDSVLLEVEDTGPGITPEDRVRIFNPFVQGKNPGRQGTGLGLTISREIARAHGGTIWAEGREGGGSRFCVLLPAHPRE